MTDFKNIEGNYLTPDQDTNEFVLNHTMLRIKDPKKSLDFYTKKLGFKVSNYMDESGSFIEKVLGLNNVFVTTVKMSLDGGQMIELLDFSSHKKNSLEKEINDIGPTHVAFTVHNIDMIYNDFKDDGQSF